jgi:hypothetical protein
VSEPRSEELPRYLQTICRKQGMATIFRRDGDTIVVDLD